ncbi:putative reverse transcriptase domain-containing protein [Tanacetum coccineum]
MAPNRQSGPNNENPDIAAIIEQQLQAILPQIVTQVTNNVNNANGGNGGGGNGNGGNNGCTFKAFQSCNPKSMMERMCDSAYSLDHEDGKLAGLAPEDLRKCYSRANLNQLLLTNGNTEGCFISTEFTPLLNVKPSIVNPGYVIEVAGGKKVEVDRIICDSKLELESSLFSINLIPLGHGSFDVIVGIDWLSQHKALIVCHEKVVDIPVEDGRILRVHGERTVGIAKVLKSVKKDELKLGDIPIVRNFEDVFPEDFSGLPPQRQVEFRIDLVPGAMPIAKSLYCLAPSEMQELSGQLQELQDKGFIRPSHSP